MAYEFDLPTAAKIYPVFHVSQLKQALGDGVLPQSYPSLLSPDFEWLPEPKEVLSTCWNTTTADWDCLIRWKHLPNFESKWEPFEKLKTQFPDFHFEDKVFALWGYC